MEIVDRFPAMRLYAGLGEHACIGLTDNYSRVGMFAARRGWRETSVL